jgi:hypothetical protein
MLVPPDESKKVKSNFSFSFSDVLFNSFWKFGFFKNAQDEKSNILWRGRKIKRQIFGFGENEKM